MNNLKTFIKSSADNFEQQQERQNREQHGLETFISKQLAIVARFNDVHQAVPTAPAKKTFKKIKYSVQKIHCTKNIIGIC